MFNMHKNKSQDGAILITILIIIPFFVAVIGSVLLIANSNLNRAKGRILALQAQYSAESGADQAIAMLNSGVSYTGTSAPVTLVTNGKLYKATYTVSVAAGSNIKEKKITATGNVYSPATATSPSFTRKIEVIAQRSSGSTASSVLSRNIIEIQSGVKNVKAIDIMANSYIHMNKNTTNIIAENITVGGKDTGASNCSIGGTGNLVKPTSFTHVGQTKTNIITAYNNCISPPGNTTNANFTVAANQTNIGTVQSTYIPWSMAMDGDYTNSPTGCSDWTSGASPRNIPSTGNSKKTHYPDSASGISTSCGTSGDIALGSGTYNIKDNVHIRANLCKGSSCFPKFYNPDQGASGIKYVFVEGVINFGSLNSIAGSGPIVFIAYGADTGTKTGMCPLGDSVYLGHDDTTSAPAIYLLATNGLCIEKTKFNSALALGGIGGKNIYIESNPGTPWDLALDPAFPTSSIPIDLSWKAAAYRRL